MLIKANITKYAIQLPTIVANIVVNFSIRVHSFTVVFMQTFPKKFATYSPTEENLSKILEFTKISAMLITIPKNPPVKPALMNPTVRYNI